jgi:hypothetical protein
VNIAIYKHDAALPLRQNLRIHFHKNIVPPGLRNLYKIVLSFPEPQRGDMFVENRNKV